MSFWVLLVYLIVIILIVYVCLNHFHKLRTKIQYFSYSKYLLFSGFWSFFRSSIWMVRNFHCMLAMGIHVRIYLQTPFIHLNGKLFKLRKTIKTKNNIEQKKTHILIGYCLPITNSVNVIFGWERNSNKKKWNTRWTKTEKRFDVFHIHEYVKVFLLFWIECSKRNTQVVRRYTIY